ncbi:MAG: hypothetical protein ACRENE_24935 [Polyangiaceae bacterium]
MMSASERGASYLGAAIMMLAACGGSDSFKTTGSPDAGGGGSGGTTSSGAGGPSSSGAPSDSSSSGSGTSSGAEGSSTAPSDASSPTTAPASDASPDATASNADAEMTVSTGVLPPVTDPGASGPFGIAETDNVGPGGNYTVIAPMPLGTNGVKNPILVWSPGAGANPALYKTLLDHIASHGFVVVSYNATAQGSDMTAGIDWIVSQSTTQGTQYYDKVDASKIAAGGQSAGSLATYAIANDARLTTTLHINGGTFAPHTDVANLVKPAQFICGDYPDGGDGLSMGDLARPNCDVDFQMTTAPVWYGDVIGASHTTIIDAILGFGTPSTDPLKRPFLAATVAWLRWQLAGDLTMKAMFVGSSCGFCTQTSTWQVQQKNLM